MLRHFLASSDKHLRLSILSRNPELFQSSHPELSSSQITFHQGDIQDPFSLLWDQAFTHILHAATVSTFGPQLTLPSDL